LAIFREIHQVQGFIDFDRGKFGLEPKIPTENPKERADVEDNFRKTAGQLIGGAVQAMAVSQSNYHAWIFVSHASDDLVQVRKVRNYCK